ncbi:hypothetical protein VII00023_02964 [Vibrio ichthyoenteri ATCC 700023]|uniref:Uncharacterized protein n=1 Tax=Vibrio ichthyoenteri ATCC 700023 TaxID=870968 RepID=F9S0Z4_9VIBR|nr:hypothetical protein [Vibrio ichthyoenteri]EGU42977.1 hypothetical protein VII00023_02964 [Vibrio ichthyoenteri ATCC 700023]
MRRTITLQPSGEYAFDIGRNALILILRNATQNVVLKGDSLTPIELSRSDIVNIEAFRTKRMFLVNENDTAITVEFQLSDTPISIREQRMALEGGVTVTDILSPVHVSEVLAPVKVAGTVPVSIQGGVSVEFPAGMEIDVGNFPLVQDVRLTNAPEVQKVEMVDTVSRVRALEDVALTSSGTHTILGNVKRKGLLIQASDANKGVVVVCGFMRLKADGIATLPATNDVVITGRQNDVVYIGEVY